MAEKEVVGKAVEVTAKNVSTLPKGRYSVGGGLILFVSSETARSWIFRYRRDGKRHDLSLGSANFLSISAAKKRAEHLKGILASGGDPRSTIRGQAVGKTFEDFATPAIEEIASVRRWKNSKHEAQWHSTVTTYAIPVLGGHSLDRITKEDVLKVLRPIWTEKPETADRLRSRLEAIFSLAIAKGLMTDNPAKWKDGLSFFLPPISKVRVVDHHAAMPLDETKDFCAKLLESRKVSLLATLFCILTASRIGEVLKATWDEIDFESATWTVPPERMKNGLEHRVPLSRQALKILEWQRLDTAEAKSSFIFPAPSDSSHPLAVDTPRKMIQKISGQPFTTHGFRSTFRDWCEENFIHPSLSEKSLAHSKGDKVVAAYQRSDLLEQRRPVMQQWADVLLPDL